MPTSSAAAAGPPSGPAPGRGPAQAAGEAPQAGFWTFPRILLCYVLLTSLINRNLFSRPEQDGDNVSDTPGHIGGEGVHHEAPSQFQKTFLHIDADAKLPVFPTKNAQGKRLGAHRNLFKSDAVVDLHLYITRDFYFDLDRHAEERVWTLNSIPYNWSFTDSPQLSWNLTITSEMLAEFHTPVVPSEGEVADKSTPAVNASDSDLEVSTEPSNDLLIPTHDPTTQKSIYAHVFLVHANHTINTSSVDYDSNRVAYERFNLIRHRKRKIEKKTYKLLESRNITEEESQPDVDSETNSEVDSQALVPYFCPTLDIAIVMDLPPFKRNDIPAVILPLMHFNDLGAYYPVIYHNDFFLSSNSLIELNETSQKEDLVLEISYAHLSFLRWHMQTQMEQQWKAQTNMGTSSERDTDMIREVLFDTNPILLVITFTVSVLHSLFDFLAFKNDIQFWRKKKNMTGLSVHSLGVNCFFQTVIFLYLMDNDTSWMILMSSGVGVLIEYWKLGKAFNVTFSRKNADDNKTTVPLSPPPTTLEGDTVQQETQKEEEERVAETTIDDSKTAVATIIDANKEPKHATLLGVSMSYKLSEGYTKSKTKEYDAIATTHLLYLVVPLVLGYSMYSLLHISHKSFYSWFLGSLVGFVYAFGFVLMTPQLFINYKLQSVAHMPWKAMVYKSLNTFIDDLFAFVIKMPVMHRIACFRDDLIFFIYLYQKWAYRVDHSRVNEFGQGGGDEEEKNELENKTEGISSATCAAAVVGAGANSSKE